MSKLEAFLNSSEEREIVEAILAKFTIGKEVTVYFDSTKPEYSVF